MGRPTLSDSEYALHFWNGVEKSEGCWVWKRSKLHHGHGQFFFKGKRIQAHRYAYMLEHGGIPESKWVLHKCDNGSCVRPDHLYAGTHADNEDDKLKRGRTCKGSKNGASKLCESQVIDIRKRLALGARAEHMRAIASEYGVSWQLIAAIRRKVKWGWLE